MTGTSRPALSARGVSKAFSRNAAPLTKLWHALAGTHAAHAFWALQGVDIEVWPGEAIGIIGRNGSGKSTLLQILCGTMQPTSGGVRFDGRISAMLELGAGFNPVFTGRENARLSAIAHGLDPVTVETRMDAIAAFADIGIYFERPVQEYSSGMYARLAFAVAAHVDATILIVDEILGVGDTVFQKKCRAYMQGFLDNGGCIVFVSHDPGAVTSLCKRAIWLQDGRKMAEGDARHVTKAYVDSLFGGGLGASGAAEDETAVPGADCQWGDDCVLAVSPFFPDAPSHGFGGCRIEDCYFEDADGRPSRHLVAGNRVTLRITGRAERRLDSPVFGFMLRNDLGQNLFGDNTYLAYMDDPVSAGPGDALEAALTFVMPYLPDGRYTLAPSVIEGTQHNHIHLDWREEAVFIDVSGSPVRAGRLGLAMEAVEIMPVPSGSQSSAAARGTRQNSSPQNMS